jgi:hypothetical protein
MTGPVLPPDDNHLSEKQPLVSATDKPGGQIGAEFSQVMGRAPGMVSGMAPAPGAIAGTTPMELASSAFQPAAPPSASAMLTQARNMHDTLGTIGAQLKTKDLKLSRSQTQIVKRNITDAHDHISKAAEKLGTNVKPLPDTLSSGTLQKFLSWVGQGQDDLIGVQNKLQEISKKPDSISVPDMMVAQMKMNQASNEVQFATILLSKIIETIRTIMQTQL